jgi:hypothetical protein
MFLVMLADIIWNRFTTIYVDFACACEVLAWGEIF